MDLVMGTGGGEDEGEGARARPWSPRWCGRRGGGRRASGGEEGAGAAATSATMERDERGGRSEGRARPLSSTSRARRQSR
jgi:hypothetical protein